MAEEVRKTTRMNADGDVIESHEVRGRTHAATDVQNLLSNVVWFLAALLLILLAFRFVFALLGANSANWFANFIYSVSHPFVAPFFGLFNYNYQYGVSKFELYTLVAMVVYAIVAWILTALINLNRPRA